VVSGFSPGTFSYQVDAIRDTLAAATAIMRYRGMRLRWLGLTLIAFAGSCVVLLPPSTRIADPLTHRPLDAGFERSFPVLVVQRDRGVVHALESPYTSPTLKPGESFLIGNGQAAAIERHLAEQYRGREGGWSIYVKDLGPSRQLVELYWVDDGYSGGGYEATPTAVRPLYRKSTGPGFAFVFGAIALALNTVLWLSGAALLRWFRARRRV
jgi:hypothetical protein